MGRLIKDKNIEKTKSRMYSLIYKIGDVLDDIESNVENLEYYDSELDELAFALQLCYMKLDDIAKKSNDNVNYKW